MQHKVLKLKPKFVGFIIRLFLAGSFVGLITYKIFELLEEDTSISFFEESRDVEIPTIHLCFYTFMSLMNAIPASEYILNTTIKIYKSRTRIEQVVESSQWKQSYYVTYLNPKMIPCFYLNSQIEPINDQTYALVTISLKQNISYLTLEFAEKNNLMMNHYWNPKLHHDLSHVHGKYFYDLTMSVTEKVPTNNFKCKERNESNPFGCLNSLYMRKLNCSFPWAHDNLDLEACKTEQDVTNLIDLTTKMSHQSCS